MTFQLQFKQMQPWCICAQAAVVKVIPILCQHWKRVMDGSIIIHDSFHRSSLCPCFHQECETDWWNSCSALLSVFI